MSHLGRKKQIEDDEKKLVVETSKHVVETSKRDNYYEGLNRSAVAYCGEIFRRFMRSGSVLELGPADGVMTDVLHSYFDDYTIVDGADFFVEAIKKRYPDIVGHACLFEEYVPSRTYDNIILGNVLEHVKCPAEILKLAASWLNTGGRIIAAVPNANSIHRQIGVLMGLLETEKSLNEGDIRSGHRRVYDMDALKSDFTNAGLKVIASGGYCLKPESNAQINAHWNTDMVNAFLRLGEKYPDIAASIYLVATV